MNYRTLELPSRYDRIFDAFENDDREPCGLCFCCFADRDLVEWNDDLVCKDCVPKCNVDGCDELQLKGYETCEKHKGED